MRDFWIGVIVIVCGILLWITSPIWVLTNLIFGIPDIIDLEKADFKTVRKLKS